VKRKGKLLGIFLVFLATVVLYPIVIWSRHRDLWYIVVENNRPSDILLLERGVVVLRCAPGATVAWPNRVYQPVSPPFKAVSAGSAEELPYEIIKSEPFLIGDAVMRIIYR